MSTIREILEEFRKVEWTMINDSDDTNERIDTRLTHVIQSIHSHYLAKLNEERIADVIRDNLQFKDLSVHNGRMPLAKAIVAELTKSMEEK